MSTLNAFVPIVRFTDDSSFTTLLVAVSMVPLALLAVWASLSQ